MRSTILLVTAFVAATSASPWGSRANKQCAAYCKEPTKFNYNVGTVYSYDYVGEAASKISGTSEEESRFHITATADFEAVSTCELVLRLKQVSLEESQPDDASKKTQTTGSVEFSSVLELHPLIFSFQDGQVEHLCPSVDEPSWSLNIKRGILSALQNSMQDTAVSQVVYETDVVGHCETNYTVTKSGRNGVTVSRSKDLLACTGRDSQHISPIQSTPYSSASSIQSLPLLKSDIGCEQTIRNQRLEKSICTETHLFRPFSNDQSGALTRISQSLTYSREQRSDEISADYKRKRASLLFENQKKKPSSSSSLLQIDEHLKMLIHESRNGVSTAIPSLFSRLITSLRPLTYRQLSDIFSKNVHPHAKKYLMDAAPLIGTAASYGLMKDIIQEGLLSDLETDMWLASLAFQAKPTSDMISVVAPLLAEETVRPKALLSISAMIHSYCRNSLQCESEAPIRQAVAHIENLIGISCFGDEKTVLLALKALGNAGIVISSAETLKKCYQEEKHSMVIRLAAIEALRRVPCHMSDRGSLLNLYKDMSQDSELRIAAYLAIMQCPTPQLLEEIKQTLVSEAVNQVGSFVWTHLTNLQETSSPGKQTIRAMLQSEFLRNKFNTDARKFSRNLEASSFSKELNIGGTVESNIIFSSQSYLPRSASLNLTLDLFGQSVNLLELGARVEGFESLVESFFGPGGLYPDSTIQEILQSMRSKRSAPVDEKSLNQLSTVFDVKGQFADQPQGDLYLRVFGNELHTHRFRGLDGKLGKPQSALSMLLQAAREKDIDFSKSVSMMDVAYVVPTAIGFPLSLNVNATAIVSFRMGGSFKVDGPTNVQVIGHIKPSATVEVHGVMSVDAWTFSRSGVQVQNTLHTSTGLSGKLIVQGSQIISVQLDAPESVSPIFSYNSRLVLLHQNGEQRTIQPTKQTSFSRKSCSPSELSRYLGVELCSEIEFWPRTPSGPRGPLTGPSHAAFFLRKTDTHASYHLDFQREGLRAISLILDTPGSQINRRLAGQVTLDETTKSLRAHFQNPQISLELTGKYEYNHLVKGVDVVLMVDGNQVSSIRASLGTDLKASSGRYEPSLIISQRGNEVFNLQGFYSYVTTSKYGFDLQLKHLTVRPIRLTGDIVKENDKYDISVGLKSYLVDTSASGSIRIAPDTKLITAKSKIEYSIMEGTSQNLEMSAKYSRAIKGSLKKTSLSGIIQSSQFPQYNGDMNWDLQRSDHYFENSLKINSGRDQWEFQQIYSLQLRDAKFRLSVTCPQQKVDWLVFTTFQLTETTFSSQSGLKLSAGRQWTGAVDLIRQNEPARYGGQIQLSSPYTTRLLKTEISQQDKLQWNFITEYIENKNSEFSIKAVYKNPTSGLKMEHSINVEIRSTLADNVDFSGIFTASPTDSLLSFQSKYGDKHAAISLEYNTKNEVEHSVTIQVMRDDSNLLQSTLNIDLGQRKSLSVDIQSCRRITLEAAMTPDSRSVTVQFFWDKEIDLTRSFEFSGKLSNTGVNALIKCADRPPILVEAELVGKDIKALVQWRSKAILLEMVLDPTRATGQLTTPLEGFENISFDVKHSSSKTFIDSQWSVDWQRDRFTVSLTGTKTSENIQSNVKLTSSYPSLANVGFDFQALSTQPEHRYTVSVQHLERKAEISFDFHRKEYIFSNANLRLVTPIRGYESLKASLHHNQQVKGFKSELKLEGPFASQAIATVSGKKTETECLGSLTLATSISAIQTSAISYQLVKARQDKKLQLIGELNGQRVAIDAAADLSDSKIKGNLRVTNPFTNEIKAALYHSFNKRTLQSQGQISWAEGKTVRMDLNGQLVSKDTFSLNITASAPGWTSSANVDHRKSNQKIVTEIEVTHNGRTGRALLDVKSMSPLLLETTVSLPYAGFENLKLNLEHRRDSQNSATILRAAKRDQVIILDHSLEAQDNSNWANKLVIKTPFDGLLASLELNSKQSWTRQKQLKHESRIEVNGKTASIVLIADANSKQQTANGSFKSSWTDDVIFEMIHTDDGQEFHPIVIIRMGQDGQPIRLESLYRRNPKNPTFSVDIISPMSDPIRISAAYINAAPIQTAKFGLNWGITQNIDYSLDWALSVEQTSIKTRLTTSLVEFKNVDAEVTYDLTGPRKTALALLKRGDWAVQLDAFAAGQGSTYQTEVVLSTPFYEKMKAVGVIDMANARVRVKLEKGQQNIQLQGILAVAPTQTSVTATLETPMNGWRNIRLEGALKSNRELQLEVDREGEKMSLTGSYSSGSGKGFLRGNLKTPFDLLSTGGVDFAYDVTGKSKTATLKLTKNHNVIQASAQATLGGPAVKLHLTLKAPCCGVNHMDFSGSLDETVERKVGFVKLELNEEKYQLDGHVIRSNGTVELSLKSITGYQGYEQVTIAAKYDIRKTIKTGAMSFTRNSDRFHLSGAGTIDNILKSEAQLELSTPIEWIRSVHLHGQYDWESDEKKTVLSFIHNDVATRLTAGAILASQRQGKIEYGLETPFVGYETIRGEVNFDLESNDKMILLMGQTTQAQLEWNKHRIAIRSTTPFTNYENLSATGAYSLDNRELRSSLKLEKNSDQLSFLFNGLFDPANNEASLELESPIPGMESISSKAKWNLFEPAKKISFQGTKNDVAVELDMTGQFSRDYSTITVQTLTNIEDWRSASLSSTYDIRSSISGNLNLERNGVQKSFAGEALLSGETAVVTVQTPFDGMRSLGLTGQLSGASTNTSGTRTAIVRIDKEGAIQDYSLNVGFDTSSVSINIETPLKDYEKISAKLRFNVKNPQKTFHLVAKKNGHQVDLSGTALLRPISGEGELKFSSTLLGYQLMLLSGHYNFVKAKEVAIKVGYNTKTIEASGNVDGLNLSAQFSSPFIGFERLVINGNVNLDAQTARLVVEHNNKPYEVTGSLKGREATAQVKTPLIGYETVDFRGRWNSNQIDIGFSTPRIGKILLEAEYSLETKFARAILTHDNVRYRNELVANIDDPWRQGDFFVGVQLPIEDYDNITTTLTYNIVDKTVLFALENTRKRYETVARLTVTPEAAQAVAHIQTPFTGFEEIDLSAGYDLTSKTVFLINERNGQSVVFVQGTATLSPSSSNLSATIRIPSLMAQDILLITAYNLASDFTTADAKIKILSHEVIFDGKRDGWTSALASISSTFDEFQKAQIVWDLEKLDAAFHFNDLKATVSGKKGSSLVSAGVTATLSAPSMETRSLDFEWDTTQGKITSRSAYQNNRKEVTGAKLFVNYSGQGEAGAYEFTINTGRSDVRDIKLSGIWSISKTNAIKATVFWNNDKKIEANFDGHVSLLNTKTQIGLTTSYFRPISMIFNYDLSSSEKSAHLVYSSDSKDLIRLNAVADLKLAKVDVEATSNQYQLTAKCKLIGQQKHISIIFKKGEDVSKLLVTVEGFSEKSKVSALFSSPTIGITQWTFNGDCDTTQGLKTGGVLSWAEDRQIRFSYRLNPTELFANLITPFDRFEKTQLSAVFNFEGQKQSIDSTFQWTGRSISVKGDWESSTESGVMFSIRVATPFQGFEEVGLRGTFLSGADYSTTLTYNRAGKVIDIQGKLTSDASGSTAKIAFTSAEDFSAVAEYDFRLSKKLASLVMSRGEKRINVVFAGEFNDKINGLLTVDTSFSHPIRLSLDLDPVAMEKNGRITVEWGQQQKLELVGGMTIAKSGSKLRLTVQTPFEGFKKIVISSKLSPKAFDISLDYGRNQKVQLNGQYRWENLIYSVNGTLLSPWMDTLSWQSYVDINTGFQVASGLSLTPENNFVLNAIYRDLEFFEAFIQTPYEILSSAKFSAKLELGGIKKFLYLGGEYNGFKANLESQTGFDGLSQRASLKGSWNEQLITLETLYRNDGGFNMFGANVTTPFTGLKHWTSRLECNKVGVKRSYILHFKTPLEAIPSIDALVDTEIESGRRFGMNASASVLDYNLGVKSLVTKSGDSYTTSLEIDVPFYKPLSSVIVRAECQVGGWKNMIATVSTGIPTGEYTVKGSMQVGKTSFNLNGAIKTPSFAKSIEMGAGYTAESDFSIVQGEAFVWSNRVEGRYEKRGSQINVDVGVSLPDLKITQTRINLDMNLRSTRQVQASLTFTTQRQAHTINLAYQSLAGSKFVGQIDIDSPLIQPKKTLSVKINYGTLSSLTIEGKYVDGQNICELTGSFQIAGQSIQSYTKLTCVTMGTVEIHLTGNPREGQIKLVMGSSTHRLAYKLNLNESYRFNIEAESPFIQPILVRGNWYANAQQGQASLTTRYGQTYHSILGDYLRNGSENISASFNMASPILPGREASFQFKYHQLDFTAQMDLFGESHRLSGQLEQLPNLNAQLNIDSIILPWKTAALYVSAAHQKPHGQANITCVYGEKSMTLAGQLHFNRWNNFDASIELNTPFKTLNNARVDVQFSSLNSNRVNASINLESSHSQLPRASFNVQYLLSSTQFDASASLSTPFKYWENLGFAMTIPLTYNSSKSNGRVILSLPKTEYSIIGSFILDQRHIQTELDGSYRGKKFGTKVILKADDIYQAKIDVTTPIQGFERYSWDIKGQASVRHWGEATAFLDWNGKRIEFNSNVKVEPLAYITVIQLSTPFSGFERYAIHLRLEGTERKTLQIEVESPELRVGADFDYVFNSATDFVSKASIRTPFAGYESFTIHLSNRLGDASYSVNAEAIFAKYGMAATIEGILRNNGFQGQVNGRYNDKVAVLKTEATMSESRISWNLDMVTPFQQMKKVEGFLQLDKDLVESKGFGLTVNGRQMMLVSLAQQPDGLRTLQIRNPWRPIDLSYSWENSIDLIHYHAQICWDLNARRSSTLGGRLIVKTSSYGRQISFKTFAPLREVSVDYALELTSTKIDQSTSISWASDKTIGYKLFLADNTSKHRHKQLDGSFRLDLPARSFQLEAHHIGGQDISNKIEFLWDAARDSNQRMGIRTVMRQGRQGQLTLFHSALEQDIIMSGELHGSRAKAELVYSPLPEHRFAIEGSADVNTINFAIRHPATNTDLFVMANKSTNSAGETFLSGRLDYLDRIKNFRFLQLGARMNPEKRLFRLEATTADNALALDNAVSVSGTSYAIISRVSVNDLDTLTLNGRLETSAARPTIQMDAFYAGGKSLNVFAGMPDRREVTFRATRDFHGRHILDGHFQIKLNRTDLLTSRVYWRSASRAELRDVFVNGLINILSTFESTLNHLSDLTISEFNDKRTSMMPVFHQISHRLTINLERELNVMRSEFKQMASDFYKMYEQNDFFLQDIIYIARQAASMAQPYLDRATKNIEAIGRALIGEGSAFYQALSSTYTTLSDGAIAAYQQVTIFVTSTATEAARHYNQLAGEVVGRLIQLESVLSQRLEQLKNLYLEYSGRLETVIMEQVENVRQQAIELAESYIESFQPYLRYFESIVERARFFFDKIALSFNDWQNMVHEQLMSYGPFQRAHALYLEYATWFEEFHVQDYIDEAVVYLNQVKQEIVSRFNSITARYQPLIDPVVQAVQGRLDSLKQMPIFAYISKAADRAYQQLQELFKYIELEAELRQILRQLLQHTDRLTNQVVDDLKGSFDFPWRPVVNLDWAAGHLEYSQKLPFTWEELTKLPRLRELPFLRKMATAKRNWFRDMDYSQFYFSVMNALATYKPMRIQSILPPFGSHAFVAGTQHYMTFDKRFYEFAGECSYLLVSDFFSNEFSAVVNYEGSNSKVTRKSLTILSDGRQIEIDSSFRVTVNGRKIEMPLIYEGTTIERDGQRVIVNNEKGYRIDCNLYRDICSVHVSGWSFGKTGGLFGVYNNEPADDFLTPFRQQRLEDEVDSFANSWKVGTARCRVRNYAVTRPAPSQRNSRLCDQIFNDDKSVLRPCYQMVDPAPFNRMCLNDLASLENSPKKEQGVCTAAAAYVNECRLAGLDLFVPPQCVRCELEDGRVMGSGEVKTFQNNAPRSADVIFVVEEKPCINGTRLSSLPGAIDAALKEKGITQNRYAVIGYGGRGKLLNRPHIRTTEGQIWSNRKSVQTTLEDLPLVEENQISDITAAIRYAVNMPFRVGVSKQIILVSCGSDCQAKSYADTLTLLIENDIKLHLIQPRDLIVKGRNNSDELKNVFGLDAEEVYTVRNIRSLKGDRELRRQLAVPKDFCTPLALETNGTLFDLKKMMPGQQQQQSKKFVDIFARRVAVTGEPSPCQRCDCIGDRDGIGSILCQRCVSPVMERLDKVWERLVYENEIENQSNMDEITLSKIKEPSQGVGSDSKSHARLH